MTMQKKAYRPLDLARLTDPAKTLNYFLEKETFFSLPEGTGKREWDEFCAERSEYLNSQKQQPD